MSANLSLVSTNNPHYLCPSAPCTVCQNQRKAEQEARDRHPAGTNVMPEPLDYEVKRDANGRFVRVHVTTGHVDLDESMLAELHSAVIADLCTREACENWATGMDGLCSDHRDMADAVQINGWRR